MSRLWIWFVLLGVTATAGLKCYSCTYATGQEGTDECKENPGNKFLKDCKYTNPVCMVSNADSGGGVQAIVRACFSGGMEMKCSESRTAGNSHSVCYCNSKDGCNGAGSLVPKWIPAIAAIIIALAFQCY